MGGAGDLTLASMFRPPQSTGPVKEVPSFEAPERLSLDRPEHARVLASVE